MEEVDIERLGFIFFECFFEACIARSPQIPSFHVALTCASPEDEEDMIGFRALLVDFLATHIHFDQVFALHSAYSGILHGRLTSRNEDICIHVAGKPIDLFFTYADLDDNSALVINPEPFSLLDESVSRDLIKCVLTTYPSIEEMRRITNVRHLGNTHIVCTVSDGEVKFDTTPSLTYTLDAFSKIHGYLPFLSPTKLANSFGEEPFQNFSTMSERLLPDDCFLEIFESLLPRSPRETITVWKILRLVCRDWKYLADRAHVFARRYNPSDNSEWKKTVSQPRPSENECGPSLMDDTVLLQRRFYRSGCVAECTSRWNKSIFKCSTKNCKALTIRQTVDDLGLWNQDDDFFLYVTNDPTHQ